MGDMLDICSNSGSNSNISTGFTVETWVRYNNFRYAKLPYWEHSVLSKHGHECGWDLRFNGFTIELLITPSPFSLFREHVEITASVEFTQDVWVHIAASYNGEHLKLYRNGNIMKEKYIGSFPWAHLAGPMSVGACAGWRDRSPCVDMASARVTHLALDPDDFLPPPPPITKHLPREILFPSRRRHDHVDLEEWSYYGEFHDLGLYLQQQKMAQRQLEDHYNFENMLDDMYADHADFYWDYLMK
eukprot:TRINITY_DN18673_c0_g1_i3.p1 TRINITY_DN18673_c0_g1~~TRINITY_DN18673_c0_g1_i3.p1  ORF type:complete len:244 (+),score=16.23 TRINITY_DN18673_c0_g1_i3:481-1212(+)